ncbi:MAG: hypothetical protein HKO94_10730, partial [Flavobacteriaceae bacterium]|nr:hypothetical protein [Flavobacteriaceae bacterium]
MKTKHIFTTLFIALFFVTITGMAQDKTSQSYWIHEDHVKPSMLAEYEAVTKELVAACKKHGVDETSWLTLATNDFTYAYVGPIDKMADLDE